MNTNKNKFNDYLPLLKGRLLI